jgi:hypothetical protein
MEKEPTEKYFLVSTSQLESALYILGVTVWASCPYTQLSTISWGHFPELN